MANQFLRWKVVYKTRIPAAMANRPAKDPPTARPPAAPDVGAGSVGAAELPVSELFWELVSEDPVELGPLGAL